jgi:methylenetetrahydrofolate reductase (NADPH)
MLDGMNRGDQTFCSKKPGKLTEKTNFLLGTAVSCFKYAESEVITQYYKLLKKVHNGAEFAITQICYDARKFDELKRFLENAHCNIPVIGSVCILNEKSAWAMNRGDVPGAIVTQKLLNQIQSETADKDNGKQASITRAAKLIAILKALGYRGAHIVGPPNYDDIREVIENFKQIRNQWRDFLDEFNYPYSGGFYLYQKDQQTGLNTPDLAKKANTSVCSWTVQTAMESSHHLLFNKNAYHYSILKRIAEIVDKKPWLKTVYGSVENITKSIMFDCRMCGDCALPDMANLCPESKCPKFLRNGPCGGSSNKFCEVRKDKLCVWVRVYERLKAHKKQDQLNQICLGPRNWALDQTSSWLNFYLNRDYHSTQKPYCPRINEIPG